MGKVPLPPANPVQPLSAGARGGERRAARRYPHSAFRHQFGQAKVQNLGLAASRHEDVRWLDIAMNDPLRVRRIQSISNLNSQLQHLLVGKRLAGDAMLERLSLQELHDDEGLAWLLLDLMNHADVGMVECGGGSGFALESLERRLIARHLFRQEFEGHQPAELCVFGLVDHAHTAASELLQDAVVRDGLANHGHSSRINRFPTCPAQRAELTRTSTNNAVSRTPCTFGIFNL